MTTRENKIAILADLWLNYRDEPDFEDFIDYNDLGLPLAYILNEEIVSPTDVALAFVDETFSLLLAGLDVDDEDFETLDDLLSSSE